MKTRRVLISKEEKTDINKKKMQRGAEFDRNRRPFDSIVNRERKSS